MGEDELQIKVRKRSFGWERGIRESRYGTKVNGDLQLLIVSVSRMDLERRLEDGHIGGQENWVGESTKFQRTDSE